MSTFEVRFIINASDEHSEHVVVQVDAIDHEHALSKARAEENDAPSIATNVFWSVEIVKL
ncbi:MAG: hypothetical protein K2X06_13650 [Burkholderiales bacterium]|nr:hypothetical protein [Burkholderiales bacterium]